MITTIVMMLALGAIPGLGSGVADRFLSIEIDKRIEKVSSMLPNYSCGNCGCAGCSGLAETLVEGKVIIAGACKPRRPDQKAAIAEYLNTMPGPDGTCVKVEA